MRSAHIRNYPGPYVLAFGLSISTYSVRMLENVDQNDSKYGHFLRSAIFDAWLGSEYASESVVCISCFTLSEKSCLQVEAIIFENKSKITEVNCDIQAVGLFCMRLLLQIFSLEIILAKMHGQGVIVLIKSFTMSIFLGVSKS